MSEHFSNQPLSANSKIGAPQRNESIVLRDGVAGMVSRCAIVTAVIAIATAGLIAAKGWELCFVGLEETVLIGISFVVWIAMMAGVVCSEYPRGDQLAMARLGLATFCRTGLPLLVVLIALNYATRLESVALYVGILYAVGLVSSLALEVSRLGFPSLAGRQIG
jgi:hypothetical protein